MAVAVLVVAPCTQASCACISWVGLAAYMVALHLICTLCRSGPPPFHAAAAPFTASASGCCLPSFWCCCRRHYVEYDDGDEEVLLLHEVSSFTFSVIERFTNVSVAHGCWRVRRAACCWLIAPAWAECQLHVHAFVPLHRLQQQAARQRQTAPAPAPAAPAAGGCGVAGRGAVGWLQQR